VILFSWLSASVFGCTTTQQYNIKKRPLQPDLTLIFMPTQQNYWQ
jgi:hypothetical protein